MNRKGNDVPKGVLPEGVLQRLADDHDPQETEEWLEALEFVVRSAGPERAAYLLERSIWGSVSSPVPRRPM